MAINVTIPELGEGIEKGDVVGILVQPGDQVQADQPLLEMETGKATVELPAPQDGTIAEILVSEGDSVAIGDTVMRMEGDAQTAAPAAPAPEPPTPKEEKTPAPEPQPQPQTNQPTEEQEIDIVVPELGEGVESGDVVGILVSPGDDVEAEQGIIEMETGKATAELPAPSAGQIIEISVQEGDKKNVGDVIGKMRVAGTSAAPAASTAAPATPEPAPAATEKTSEKPAPPPAIAPVKRSSSAPIPAAPSVRKFAREIGIDISTVPGSGPKGRISIEDVKAWSRKKNSEAPAPSAGGTFSGVTVPPLPDFSAFGNIKREPMSTIRKLTKDHMAMCWSTIPHVTNFDEADITELEKMRKSFQPKAEAAGGKLTVAGMLIKILASALKAFPQFNVSIDVENEEIIHKDYFNIGVAVDTPKGLVVPVLRDVDRKNMIEIAVELVALAGDMRKGKISPSLLQGGCITLTNLGGLHGKHFTPIVNHPEVAILGVGRAQMKPVWQDGAFVPRLMMPLSLSYDHRVIDGADGARFMKWVIDALEQPLLISLEG